MSKPLYKIMLLFSTLATLGGILTMIPWPWASYPNIIGYSSLCTFAPAATLFCFTLAGISCYLRASLVKDDEGSVAERLARHAHSLIPIAILLIAAVIVTVIFMDVKTQYEAVSGASEFLQ